MKNSKKQFGGGGSVGGGRGREGSGWGGVRMDVIGGGGSGWGGQGGCE